MQKIQELTQQDKDRFMEILKDYIQAINQVTDKKETIVSFDKWKNTMDSILEKINLETIFLYNQPCILQRIMGKSKELETRYFITFFRKNFDERQYPHKFLSGPYIALGYSPINRDFTLLFFISQIIPNKNVPTYKGPSKEFFKKAKMFDKEYLYQNQSIFSKKFLDDFITLANAFNSLEIDDFGAIDDFSYCCFHLFFPRIYIFDLTSVKNNDYFEAMEKLFENPVFAKKNQHIKIQCQESDGSYFYIFTDSDYQNLYFAIKGEKSKKPFMVSRKDFLYFLTRGTDTSHLESHQEYMNDFWNQFQDYIHHWAEKNLRS